MTVVELLLAYAGVACLIIGFLATRRIHAVRKVTFEKLERYRERLETISNYNKLAAVRIAEAGAKVAEAEEELKSLENEQLEIHARISEAKTANPSVFYVFDRGDNRKDKLFDFVVEATAEGSEWTGPRHYVVAAPSLEQATERIRDRFPSFSGFRISEGTERSRF